MDPTPAPPGTSGQYTAYDEESDVVILFGGHKTGESTTIENYGHTWSYDYNTNTWNNMTPTSNPEPRMVSSMVYDNESDVMVLFGGIPDYGGFTGGTWVYDYNANNWTNMYPASPPRDRGSGEMAYDSESDKVILFGGGGYYEGLITLSDTWVYDYNDNTWSEMNPVENPAFIGNAVYDSQSDRVIYHGGARDWGETLLVQETWAYDYNTNTWEEMSPSRYPTLRARCMMVYDRESDLTILYGGFDEDKNVLNDIWTYDYESDSWELIGESPVEPTIPTTPTPHTTTGPPPLELVLFGVAGAAIIVIVIIVWLKRK
jgi:hypothetical protein